MVCISLIWVFVETQARQTEKEGQHWTRNEWEIGVDELIERETRREKYKNTGRYISMTHVGTS